MVYPAGFPQIDEPTFAGEFCRHSQPDYEAMTNGQYLKTKKRLAVELRSEQAKLNYGVKNCNDEMAESSRARVAVLERQMNELERQE
jgi:hypothetical protein